MRLNNHQRRRISLGVKRYVELPKTVTNNAEKRENIRGQKCQTVSQYNTIQYNTIQYNIYLIQFENTGDGSCLNPIICTIVPLMVIIVN